MDADTIEVRANVKVGTVLRYLRVLETLPPQTDMLMVVDRQGPLPGRAAPERTGHCRAGLDDEADIFAPVLVSSRRRALWLAASS